MIDGLAQGATVLVTGGSGFLGRPILDALVSHGYHPRSLQRAAAPDLPGESVAGDIRDPEVVRRALSGVAAVVHAAGLAHVFASAENAAFDDVNERGTATVARETARAGVPRLVVVSSVSVYGRTVAAATEDAALRPTERYARSKAAGERAAVEAVAGSRTALTILRLATLYGEGDRGNVQRLLRAIASRRFVWIGSGKNLKSLLHVKDAAEACVLPLTRSAETLETFNVSGPPVTMRSIVEGLASALDRPPPRMAIPSWIAVGVAAAAHAALGARGRAWQATVSKWLADDVYPADRFRQRYGYQTAIDLERGLREQVRWWCRSQECPR